MPCFLTIEFLLRDEGLDDSVIDLRNWVMFEVLKWLKFSELGGKLEVDAIPKKKKHS
jgi:hypothetical protein